MRRPTGPRSTTNPRWNWTSWTKLWKLAADLPAGTYSFKIALNRSWDENFGAFGAFDGANHEVHHGGGQLVIHYDHRTRDIVLA